MKRFTIDSGTRDDYLALRAHHYATGEPATIAMTLRATWDTHLAGVIVISYPTLNADWRERAFGSSFGNSRADNDNTRRALLVNRHIRAIARVIVDPRFRGNGIATALVRHYLAQPLTRCTEAVSVLNAFVPLFERSGMRRLDLPPSLRDRALTREINALHLTPLDLATLAASSGLSSLNHRTLTTLHPALLRWGQSHRGTRRLSCPTTLARHAARCLLLPRVAFVHGQLDQVVDAVSFPCSPAPLSHNTGDASC